jgi:hypothetical protein
MTTTTFVSFPLYRNVTGTGGVQKDAIGYFSCRLATAKFLDIDKIAEATTFALTRTRKQSKPRDLTLIDGTRREASENENGSAKESEVLASISRTGTNSVQLVTGKKTANKNYKRVTFRFPSFATNLNISDALGSLIPAQKIKAGATADDVFNFFISKGGKRYPILTKASAEAEKSSETPSTKQQAQDLLNKISGQKAAQAEF